MKYRYNYGNRRYASLPQVYFGGNQAFCSALEAATEQDMTGYELPYLVGLNVEGEAIIGDFANVRFLQISGVQGSGKTNYSMQLITSLMYLNAVETLRIWTVDTKGNLAVFSPLVNAAHTREKAIFNISVLRRMMNKKEEIIRQANVNNIKEFNSLFGRSEKYYLNYDVVIIDEQASSFDGDQEVINNLINITERGRSSGVFLVQMSQTVGAKELGGDKGGRGKAQFTHKAIFLQPNEVNARVAGSQDTLTLKTGEFIWKTPTSAKKYTSILMNYSDLRYSVDLMAVDNLFFKDNFLH